MADRFRLTLAQLNPTTGALAGNAQVVAQIVGMEVGDGRSGHAAF